MLRVNSRLGGRLASGSFGHNVFLMFVGTAMGQMASIILSPALTRIYSPDDFGVLGIYMTVVTLLSLIAALRYEIAIPLTKSEEETSNILAVCILALFVTSAAIGIILYFIPSVPDFLQSSIGILWPYRMMVPVGVFAIGAYQISISYATHMQTYKAISQTKVYQGYGGPITQIILGLAGANIWGLIIGFIVGQSLGVTMLFKRLIPNPAQVIKYVSRASMKMVAWRFRGFPLISSISVLIAVLGGESLLIIVISMIYHSTTVVGYLFLINRIVGRPLLMISTSILQVYIGDVSKTQTSNPKAMRSRFLNVIKFQFVIVAAWLALINATAYYIIPFAFGQEWADCVPYIHILTISYLPAMTMHAVNNTLQILEKQKLSAMLDVVRLLALICVFIACYMYKAEVMQLLIAYCITQAIGSVVSFVLMYKSIQSIQIKEE